MHTEYRYLNTTINVYSKENYSIELLQSSNGKYPLSEFYSKNGKIKAIINFPYFTNEYVLGRNQGDERNDTHDQPGFYDLVFTNDGKYHLGQFKSWDYTTNVVAGFSVATVLIKDGQDCELFSSAICDYSKLTRLNPQTAIAVLKNGDVLYVTSKGRIRGERGLSGFELRDFLKSKYDIELLCQGDGGGSTQMNVDGKIVHQSSDGRERPMYCGLAFIDRSDLVKPDKPQEKPQENAENPTNVPMFVERLSRDGLDGNAYWYSKEYSPFAIDDLWLPNCTNYAWGRSSEIASRNIRKDLMDTYPDAKRWYANAKWQKGATPKVGAIAVWGGNQYGHVAIVEQINGDEVLFSQSNYKRPIDKNSSSYFETQTYKPVVGKVTSGVGLTFLGYIYNPYINDLRVKKDSNRDQIEVLADLIRVRKSPNGEVIQGCFCPKGLYNVLEFKEDDYVWAKLDNDLWIATNDKDGWTNTYLKAKEEESIKEANARLLEENTKLKAFNANLTGENAKLKDKLESVETKYNSLDIEYSKLESELLNAQQIIQQIKNILK